MSNKKRDDVRSRDDSHLRELISKARAWMKAEGVEEQALDWEAVAREERALWWRERLQQSLTDLAKHGRGFADSTASRLRQLADVAGAQAEAALEVTLDAARQMGHVLPEPAQACLRPGTDFQFRHAQPTMRSDLGFAEGDEENIGLFFSSRIPAARVTADEAERTVTVEFLEPLTAHLVILVPEDPSIGARVVEATKSDGTVHAVFSDVQPGRFLLSVYPLEEDRTL